MQKIRSSKWILFLIISLYNTVTTLPKSKGCFLNIKKNDYKLFLCVFNPYYVWFNMSLSWLLRYIALTIVRVSSYIHGVKYHWNQYNKEILKRCWSVSPSICSAIKIAYYSFIKSMIIISIWDESVSHSFFKYANEAMFANFWSSYILDIFFENWDSLPTGASLLMVEW